MEFKNTSDTRQHEYLCLQTAIFLLKMISHKKPNVYQKGSSKILQTQDSMSIFGKESVNNFLA